MKSPINQEKATIALNNQLTESVAKAYPNLSTHFTQFYVDTKALAT